MKEFLYNLHKTVSAVAVPLHQATCNFILIPVISWLKGISLEDAYNNWRYHSIYKKFL